MNSNPPPCLDGQDIWQFEKIEERYRRYCSRYRVEHSEIRVSSFYLDRNWTSGILRQLIERMKLGDLAAAEIGIEMMEEERGLAFGSSVKSNIPRALAKCELSEAQKERVRERVVSMLHRHFLPKEFRQYAWLVRRIGLAVWEKKLDDVSLEHPWAEWYVHYLTCENPPPPPH